MKEYLVFWFYGVMVSWGVFVVGGDRVIVIVFMCLVLLGLFGVVLGVIRDNVMKLEVFQ